jgi:hypothetical protein
MEEHIEEPLINIIDLRTGSGVDNLAVLVEIRRGKNTIMETIAFVKYDDYSVVIGNTSIKQYCLAYAKENKRKPRPNFGIMMNGGLLIVKW